MSLIRALLVSLLLLFVVAAVGLLVYSNMEPLTLKLEGVGLSAGIPNPFAQPEQTQVIELPAGVWYVLFLIGGLKLGLFAGWFLAGDTRVRARQQGRRARVAERALAGAKQEREDAKSEIDTLKVEKKDLETKVQVAEAKSLDGVGEVKQITRS